MNFLNRNAGVIALVAIILAVGGYFYPQVKATLGAIGSYTNFYSLKTDADVSVGTSATVGTTLGVASTSPLGTLGIGAASATSTISGGHFCAYFRDEKGRGMWIKLATSGNVVFATSTKACN